MSPSLDLDAGRQKEALQDPSRTISTEVTPGVSFRHEDQTRLYNPYEGGYPPTPSQVPSPPPALVHDAVPVALLSPRLADQGGALTTGKPGNSLKGSY